MYFLFQNSRGALCWGAPVTSLGLPADESRSSASTRLPADEFRSSSEEMNTLSDAAAVSVSALLRIGFATPRSPIVSPPLGSASDSGTELRADEFRAGCIRILSDATAVAERLLLRFGVSQDRSSSIKGAESESELSPLGRMLRRALTRFVSLRVVALRIASVGVVLRRVALHCWTLRFAPLRGYDHFVFFCMMRNVSDSNTKLVMTGSICSFSVSPDGIFTVSEIGSVYFRDTL